MHDIAPRLLAVAHGTASVAGSATTARLVAAISAARPNVAVDLCFLDVVAPRLPDALDDRPTIVVPLLLSTGFHVQTDIPAAVGGYPNVRVARHLGPHPLLVDALVDRLGDAAPAPHTTLVGAGSTRPEAAAELATTATLLGRRLERPVTVLTMGQQLRPAFEATAPVQVATYLLAEGQFVTSLQRAVDGLGSVAAPLGVHPALVRLVWTRYDEAAAMPSGAGPPGEVR
jgi:sirohydrochlorin ferrochelatase